MAKVRGVDDYKKSGHSRDTAHEFTMIATPRPVQDSAKIPVYIVIKMHKNSQ